uniref:Nucleoporin NDC1 n=1 Tax=Parascaris univalens TaxID=6257 RepID=A0A914ZQL9_PARUN
MDFTRQQSPQSTSFMHSSLQHSIRGSPQLSPSDQRVNSFHPMGKVEDSLTEWFEQLIEIRRLKAAMYHAIISIVLYILCACVLQFSLFHPVRTIFDIVALFTSSRIILFIICYALMNTISTYVIGRFLLRFDREKRISKSDWRVWCIFAVFLLVDNIKGFLLFRGSGVKLVEGFLIDAPSFVVRVPIFVATFLNVFECDYRLQFPALEFGALHQIQTALRLGNEAVLARLMPIMKWTAVFTLFCGLPLYGLALLMVLFSAKLLISIMVLVYSQAFLHYLSLKSLKACVLQHYSFALPPPHVIVEPTPEELRTLPNALESSCINLKAFAFWDLRKLSASNYQRRMVLFSLSQPGGHPRNWNAVSVACMKVLERIKRIVDEENARIRLENFVSLNRISNGTVSKIGGPTMLLPNRLRRDQDLCRRILKDQPVDNTTMATSNDTSGATLWHRIKLRLAKERRIITAIDETLAMLSIESLCMLIWHSYEEDRYGVVQKDLSAIISLMLQLVVSFDRYIRNIKPAREEQQSPGESVYYLLNNALCSALSRIVAKFRESLKAIQLSAEELALLGTVTQTT